MWDRCVRGNHEIEIHHDRGRVHKRTVLFIDSAKVDDRQMPLNLSKFPHCSLLKADEFHAWDFGKRRKAIQRNVPLSMSAVSASTLPIYPDAKSRYVRKPSAPFFNQCRIRMQIGYGSRNCVH